MKAINVLLGASYELYLADFGLARVVNNIVDDKLSKTIPAHTFPEPNLT